MSHVALALGVVLKTATIAVLNEALPYFEATLLNDTGFAVTATRLGVDLGVGGVLNCALVIANKVASDFTLDVSLETSPDNSTWRTAFSDSVDGAFAQKTANSTTYKTFMVDRYVRATATIGGTSPACDMTLIGQIRF